MESNYTPIFKIMDRDGKKSLWVVMPNEEAYNIWDLKEKECTEEVKNAIIHAFQLGEMAVRQRMEQARIHMSTSSKFIEVDKK